MRTDFTAEQLADPDIAASEKVLRNCTHCGFCTATCPTYVLLGDELDSPRGRIYLIKDMLAGSGSVTADTVKHVDRCLSCLSCMTTCPSGVNYMHLVDHARHWIEENYRRPRGERMLRRFLAAVFVAASTASALAALRGSRHAVFGFSTRAARSAFGVGTRLDPACLVDRSPKRLPGRGRAANAGSDVVGMRSKGTCARNQ
jgi:glycolate oxidase iron-sulfur subunit